MGWLVTKAVFTSMIKRETTTVCMSVPRYRLKVLAQNLFPSYVAAVTTA